MEGIGREEEMDVGYMAVDKTLAGVTYVWLFCEGWGRRMTRLGLRFLLLVEVITVYQMFVAGIYTVVRLSSNARTTMNGQLPSLPSLASDFHSSSVTFPPLASLFPMCDAPLLYQFHPRQLLLPAYRSLPSPVCVRPPNPPGIPCIWLVPRLTAAPL